MTAKDLIQILQNVPQDADMVMRVDFQEHKLLCPLNYVRNCGSTVWLGDKVAEFKSTKTPYPVRDGETQAKTEETPAKTGIKVNVRVVSVWKKKPVTFVYDGKIYKPGCSEATGSVITVPNRHALASFLFSLEDQVGDHIIFYSGDTVNDVFLLIYNDYLE